MRRERRPKVEDNGFRSLMFWAGGVLLVAVIAFTITYAVYSNKVKQESRVSQLNSQKIGELVPSLQTDEETESASLSIGKTVNEMQNNVTNEVTNSTNTTNTANQENKTNNITTQNTNIEANQATQGDTKTEAEETKKELSFKMPVEGEIVRNFAKDNLVYSTTLDEWITHLGIDIKADKTTVVKASEAGTVKSIKNDPRYGLTVVIEHESGFKTVYSNLLTAEFISEGEEVIQGQTVGTVGTTATFEVADDPHLHFEILKDNEQEDPTIYLK